MQPSLEEECHERHVKAVYLWGNKKICHDATWELLLSLSKLMFLRDKKREREGGRERERERERERGG